MDLLIASFFGFMFYSTLNYNFGMKAFNRIMLLSLVPAVLFTVRAFSKSAAISINRKGIWFSRILVCIWENFISAKAEQQELAVGGWSDQVFLSIRYFKGTEGDIYKKSIQLGSTQDKSEEEIIAAIEYFYELYKKGLPV